MSQSEQDPDVEKLRPRLQEAEEILDAIRRGEVDAFVVRGETGERVLTLKSIEQPYRVLTEEMNEGAVTANEDGTVLYTNQRFAEMVRMPLERVMGGPLHRFVTEKDRVTLEALLHQARKHPAKGPFTIVGQDGSTIPAQFSARALAFENFRGVGIVITDLSERQRNEQIVAAERLARSILEQAAEAIVVCGADGRITRANNSAMRLCGMNPLFQRFEEAFNLRSVREGGYENQELHLAISALQGKVERGLVTELMRADGEVFQLAVSAAPLLDQQGGILGCVITLSDISERMRMDRARRALTEITATLGQSLAADDALLASVPNQIVPFFADWCVLDVIVEGGKARRHGAELLPNAKVGTTSLRTFDPREADEPWNALVTGSACVIEKAAERDETDLAQQELKRGLGGVGARSLISVPLEARGHALGALSFAWTVTNRRYRASDLPFAEDIARRVAYALDNARLYRQAQQAVVAREEFMSIASHELRTPLSTMTLEVALLERTLPIASKDVLEAHVKKLGRQAARMAGMIDKLLDVARISSGQFTLTLAECDLAAIVRDVVDRFSDEAAQAGVEIKLDTRGPAAGVWDRFRIEQVVTNLLSNAIKFGPGRPVEINLAGRDDAVLLTVRDYGIGIAPADVQRLFGLFQRSTATRSYAGVGLGLYIANQIVLAHGGSIRVLDQDTPGSTFVVELPRTPPPRQPL